MLATGRWAFLDLLRGTAEPEMLFPIGCRGSDRHSLGAFVRRCKSDGKNTAIPVSTLLI